MNSMTEAIKHLRAAQPHMQAMGSALDRYALPDVPQMIVDAQDKAKRMSRLDELVGIAEFIGGASLLECKHIINELADRVSTLTGCATELEDASCALTKQIETEADVVADQYAAYLEDHDER